MPEAGSAELVSAAAETVLSDEKVIAGEEKGREMDSYREKEIQVSTVPVEWR